MIACGRWRQIRGGLAALLLLSGSLVAETFIVGYYSHGMPPLFFAQSDPRQGIYQEVLSAVGEITGDRFVPRYASVPRIINDFGKICDIEPGIHPSWRPEQEAISLYSYPFMVSGDVLVMRPEHAFTVDKPEDLQGHRVGLVRGYLYPGWMPAEGGYAADFSLTEQQLFEKFRRQRLDYFFSTPVVVDYQAREHQLDLIKSHMLYEFPISFRLYKGHQPALERINKALRQLQAEGTLARILEKYNAELP